MSVSEWHDEVLAERVGRAIPYDAVRRALDDDRFLEWCAADARDAARHDHRALDGAIAARGEAIMARAQARALGVARARHPRVSLRAAPRSGERHAAFVDLGIAAGVGRELWDETPEQWFEIPHEMPDGAYVALRVVGESMAPLVRSGDTVLVRRGAEVRAGTMIVARHPDDGYLCKKVSGVTRREIELASLAPGLAPVRIPRRAELIVGTVLMVWSKRAPQG